MYYISNKINKEVLKMKKSGVRNIHISMDTHSMVFGLAIAGMVPFLKAKKMDVIYNKKPQKGNEVRDYLNKRIADEA